MSTCVYGRAWWASQGQQIIPVNFSCPFLLVLGFLMISLCFQIEVINSDPHRRDLRRGSREEGVEIEPESVVFHRNYSWKKPPGTRLHASPWLLPGQQRGRSFYTCPHMAGVVNLLKWQASHF